MKKEIEKRNFVEVEEENNLPIKPPEFETGLVMNSLTNNQVVYHSASLLQLTKEEEKKLQKEVNKEDIEIRPDGLIFLPQAFFRDILNDTFGRGQWSLVIHRDTKDQSRIYVDGSLYIRGHFVSRAIGEQEYHENNPMQSWASAWESAKSDCITRCCKDLGVAKELWMPKFAKAWVSENAIKVFVKSKDGKTKVQWRMKNSEPFWNESGIAEDKTPKKATKTTTKKATNKKDEFNPEAVFKNCKTEEEIIEVWRTIPKEKRDARLRKEAEARKEFILSQNNLPGKTDNEIIFNMINGITETSTEDYFKIIDSQIENKMEGEQKTNLIKHFANKLSEFNYEYEIEALPF